jgi:hypothetical protein
MSFGSFLCELHNVSFFIISSLIFTVLLTLNVSINNMKMASVTQMLAFSAYEGLYFGHHQVITTL